MARHLRVRPHRVLFRRLSLPTMRLPILVGLLVFAALPLDAAAQTALFTRSAARTADLSPREARYLDAVQADGSARATEVVSATPDALLGGGEIELAVGQSRVTLRPDRVETLDNGLTTWSAFRDGAEPVQAVFTVRKGVLAGDMLLDGVRYAVRPLSADRYVIATGAEDFQIDTGGLLARATADAGPHRAGAASGTAARRVDTELTLMAVYTASLADALYDPVLVIQQAVAYTNQVFDNSQIPLDLRLVHSYEDDTIPDYADIGDYLDAITNAPIFSGSTAAPDDGIADAAVALRDTFGADFVTLFHTYDNTGTAGLATVCASARSAFSAVEGQSSFASPIFTHELGHNLGSAHDVTAGDQCGVTYSHAWSSTGAAGSPSNAGTWQTIMWPSVSSTVIPYFSNDALTYNGSPLGDATDADNARLFSERAATMAAFRGAVALGDGVLALADADGTIEQGSRRTATLTVQNTGTGPLSVDTPLHRPVADGPLVADQAFASIRGTGAILPMDEGTCAPGGAGFEDRYDTIALPFAFPFDGEASSTVRVSGQGFLLFGDDLGCPPSPPSIPDAAAPNGLVSAFWSADVNAYYFSTPSAVVTQDLGGGRFAVEWSRYGIAANTGNYYVVSAQVILSSTGAIEIVYSDDFNGYVANGTLNDITIGVEGRDGTAGTQIPFADVQTNNAITFGGAVLTVEPQSAEVAAGTTLSLPVTVDATNLTPGSYTFSLDVRTANDASAADATGLRTLTFPIDVTVVAPSVAIGGTAGWRLVAAPLDGMTVADLAAQNLVQGVPAGGGADGYYASADPNVFTGYDGASFAAASSPTEAVAPGRGVFWYLFDADITPAPNEGSNSVALPFTFVATGATVTENVAVALHGDGDGFNLLGNPFSAALDVSDLASWPTSGALTSAVAQLYRDGAYVLSTNAGDQVEPFEGFFVENADAPGLVIPTAARASAGTFLRRAERPRLALRLDGVDAATGAAVRDEALTLVFAEDATEAWDVWDATKLESPDWPSLIAGFDAVGTVDDPKASVWKAQDSRPLASESVTLPIRVGGNGFAGRAVLSWPTLDLLPDAWSLSLLDHETGRRVDLREEAEYAFDVTTAAEGRTASPGRVAARTAGPARFTLSVSASSAVSNEPETPQVTRITAVYPNPLASGATVAFELADREAVALRVVDALGRVVHQEGAGDLPAGAHALRWDASRVAAGVYLVELAAGAERFTRSVVVQR